MFWKGSLKGFTRCDPQELCCADDAIFRAFSAKNCFGREKGLCCKKRGIFTKNCGLCFSIFVFPFLSSTPFEKTLLFVFLLYFSLFSPFLACLKTLLLSFKQTSLTSPFQTQVAFIFGCLVLLLFCFDYLCLCYQLVFCCFGCVCCLMKKHCFLSNSSVSWCILGSKVVFQLYVCMHVRLVFFFSKHNTRLFACLYLAVWFFFVCFSCFSHFLLLHALQETGRKHSRKLFFT